MTDQFANLGEPLPPVNARIGKIDPPQKTYFYKRKNGTIFACHAIEAFTVHQNPDFTQVGVSKGEVFYKYMVEAAKTQDRNLIAKGYEEELKVAMGNLEVPPSNQVKVIGGQLSGLEMQSLLNN